MISRDLRAIIERARAGEAAAGGGGAVRETPILFSGDMVRAILSGAKTQTRRPIRHPIDADFWDPARPGVWEAFNDRTCELVQIQCPYGGLGDRLWVRETWCPRSDGATMLERIQRPFYRADGDDSDVSRMYGWRWRPSIHMPRWASRITLPVVAVRIERVQDITAEDAKAEGVTVPRCGCEVCSRGTAICPADATSYIEGFRDLWAATYGRASWEANPWVWVVEWSKAQVRQ